MNILVTGCAGFIGFHLCAKILKNKSNIVFGIDNLNNYYPKQLKKDRLKILRKYNNFNFFKFDIHNKIKLDLLKKKKIDIIIHLAAQAGVRYSLINPESYIKSNIDGFYNILELSRIIKVKKFIYASSSSVYGDQKKFPIRESFFKNQKNLYALTKDFNEKLASIYFANHNIPLIGLRFFTVYGPWGRPDMLYFKYLNALRYNKQITLYNNGNHYRDFTYIDDVIEILLRVKKLSSKNYKNQIFNICSGHSVNLIKFLSEIEKLYGKKCKIKKVGNQKIEIFKTHGDNTLIKELIKKYQFTNYRSGLKKTVEWFKSNYLK